MEVVMKSVVLTAVAIFFVSMFFISGCANCNYSEQLGACLEETPDNGVDKENNDNFVSDKEMTDEEANNLPKIGEEGGGCYPNDTCDSGLKCIKINEKMMCIKLSEEKDAEVEVQDSAVENELPDNDTASNTENDSYYQDDTESSDFENEIPDVDHVIKCDKPVVAVAFKGPQGYCGGQFPFGRWHDNAVVKTGQEVTIVVANPLGTIPTGYNLANELKIMVKISQDTDYLNSNLSNGFFIGNNALTMGLTPGGGNKTEMKLIFAKKSSSIMEPQKVIVSIVQTTGYDGYVALEKDKFGGVYCSPHGTCPVFSEVILWVVDSSDSIQWGELNQRCLPDKRCSRNYSDQCVSGDDQEYFCTQYGNTCVSKPKLEVDQEYRYWDATIDWYTGSNSVYNGKTTCESKSSSNRFCYPPDPWTWNNDSVLPACQCSDNSLFKPAGAMGCVVDKGSRWVDCKSDIFWKYNFYSPSYICQ